MGRELSLRRLPKVELHRHLDGSIRVRTIVELARAAGLGVPPGRLTITEPLGDLPAVLDRFSTMQRVLCSSEAVSRVAEENVEDCWRDGVVLAELRFAPAFIAGESGRAHREIVEAVAEGVMRGMRRWPVRVGLVGILVRGAPISRNEEALRAVLDFRASGQPGADLIVGLDLADREEGVDPLPLVPLVDAAREAGLGITVHSGENTSADHVRRTLDLFRPRRIGHGVRSTGDPELLRRLRAEDVLLEICPTSNWLTRSVPSLEAHPLPALVAAGVPVSLNSDDPNLFAIDLTNEYELCRRLWGLGAKEFAAMNAAALAHSFLPERVRAEAARLLAGRG